MLPPLLASHVKTFWPPQWEEVAVPGFHAQAPHHCCGVGALPWQKVGSQKVDVSLADTNFLFGIICSLCLQPRSGDGAKHSMGQPPQVPRQWGTAGVLSVAWVMGCPLHTPFCPTSMATRGCSHLCSALFSPHSYFRSMFSAPLLSHGLAGFVSTCLLKDNSQMGALIGGLDWAAGCLIQAW